MTLVRMPCHRVRRATASPFRRTARFQSPRASGPRFIPMSEPTAGHIVRGDVERPAKYPWCSCSGDKKDICRIWNAQPRPSVVHAAQARQIQKRPWVPLDPASAELARRSPGQNLSLGRFTERLCALHGFFGGGTSCGALGGLLGLVVLRVHFKFQFGKVSGRGPKSLNPKPKPQPDLKAPEPP